jgi:hypothetical protein
MEKEGRQGEVPDHDSLLDQYEGQDSPLGDSERDVGDTKEGL